MKNVKVISVIVGILVLISFVTSSYIVLLPTKSSAKKLTLVQYGYFAPERVTVKHYINDKHICDYILDLKVELMFQTTQKYSLPKIDEGNVVVEIKLENSQDILNIQYNDAAMFYKNGLLIYTTNDFSSSDKYVYFVSGNDSVCYNKKEDSVYWNSIDDFHLLRSVTREEIAHIPGYYGWKENTWTKGDGSVLSQFEGKM